LQEDCKEAESQKKAQQDLRYDMSILEAKYKQMQRQNEGLEAELQAERTAVAGLQKQLEAARAGNVAAGARCAEVDSTMSTLRLQLKESEERNEALAQQVAELQQKAAAVATNTAPAVQTAVFEELPAETADNAALL